MKRSPKRQKFLQLLLGDRYVTKIHLKLVQKSTNLSTYYWQGWKDLENVPRIGYQ